MRNPECGNCRPCRIFIKFALAVEIAKSPTKSQAAIFWDKFGVNQHDNVFRRQQSLDI